jgi:hypothetical protein
VLEKLERRPLGNDEERYFIRLITQRDGNRLKQRLIDTVNPYRSLKLFRFALDAYPSGGFQKFIDLA